MTLRIPTFQVLLDTASGPAEHTVQVRPGDQMRAELEAAQQGLPLKFSDAPTHHTALWLWAACTRLGLTTVRARAFTDSELLAVGQLKEDDDEGELVDPTVPGLPSGPGSS